MYHTIIHATVACIFSVFDLKNTGCALGYSCYKIDALWTTDHWIADLTNGLCENYCQHAAANYAYYGTSNSDCYCREAELSESDKMGNDNCTAACEGSNEEFCGGHIGHWLITGSEIDRTMNTLCYKLDRSWIYTTWNVIPSNILCENQCKENSANYQYYGTSYDNCYCRKTELLDDHKEEHHRCTHQCSVDSVGICGGFHGEDRLLTVSEIDYGYLPVNMRGQLSLAASPYKITDDRSVGIVGKQCYKFDESWTYTSWNNQSTNIVCEDLCKEADVNNQYYGTMYDECYCRQTEPPNDTIEKIELCNEQCSNNTFEICGGYHVDYSLMTVSEIDRTSVTVIETNTQKSSATYVSTRDSAMTEFMNMITSDTSLAITTKSTPFTSRELSSTTSQNANNDILPVMTETSPQAITDRTSETVIETNTQRSSATYVSTRDSAMTEFINMITSDTSLAITTKSTPFTSRELSSTASQNANNDILPGTTETSTQAITDRTSVTVTETNTQRSSATYVSTRDSAMTEFINMITSDTSLAITTNSTPFTSRELSSTASKTANNDIPPVMNETSTQTITANGEWSIWNGWTFCVVNCVREDTTNGTQRRRRTCNGSECSGDYIEDRACSEPDICKGMRPRKLLCKCPKRLINTKWHNLDGKNITDDEVKKIVLKDFNQNIKSEISVDKKAVSKESRKKNSSANKRKSSQSLGWGSIIFLVLPVIFLIAIDILHCCIHFRSRSGGRKPNRIRPIRNTHDQRTSTKPVQENDNVTESYYASRCGNDYHPDEMKRETYQRRRDDNNQQGRNEWLQYI